MKKSVIIPQRETRKTVDLPVDLVISILSYLAKISPSCAVKTLLISRALNPSLESAVFSSVSLVTVSGLASFESLLKKRPEVGRRVVSLWIAPCQIGSDLITSLSPPNGGDTTTEAPQKRVHEKAKSVLRACRRLRHLALDGGFLTPHAVAAFGTPCKPITLLCVNAHSFLGHFSAPLFKHIRRLEIVDTTLAVEEVDEVRQMQSLRHFIWTSPRSQSDVRRDVSVLLRIVSPRAAEVVPITHRQGETTFVQALAESGTSPPEKPRVNDQLTSICASTAQGRAASFAASFRRAVTTSRPTSGAQTPTYVDSVASESEMLHFASGVHLLTRALSSLASIDVGVSARAETTMKGGVDTSQSKEDALQTVRAEEPEIRTPSMTEDEGENDEVVVEEWETLRDVVCQRRQIIPFSRVGTTSTPTTYGSSMWAAETIGAATASPNAQTRLSNSQNEGIDGGKALERVWKRWTTQVRDGSLDEISR